jgi:phage terminase small subunit
MAEQGRKLTPRQLRFVKDYVENGGFAAPAARSAGYTPKTARFASHKFLDIPHVLAAIRLEVQKKLDAGVALAASVLEKLATSAKSEAVQLQAAEALLNRGGMRLAALTQHEHTHLIRDERTDAELRARITELHRELGISGKVIEGEVISDVPALPDLSKEGHDIFS